MMDGQVSKLTSVHVEEDTQESSLMRTPFFIALITLFLLPVAIIPGGATSFAFTKTIILAIGLIASFVVWLLWRLREGEFSIPRSFILLAGGGLLLAYFISGMFSDAVSVSLIGRGFEIGTFTSVSLLVGIMLIVSLVFRGKQELFYLYLAFFASFGLVSLLQVSRLLLGPEFLSLGVLTSSVSNTVGKWSDLGVFYGLGAILSLVTLEFLNVSRLFKVLLYISLALSVFFIALSNFLALWVVVGFIGFIVLVYLLSFNPEPVSASDEYSFDPATAESPASGRRKFSVPAIGIIVAMLVLIVSSGSAGGSVGSFLAQSLGVAQIEARPSWVATYDVTNAVWKEDALLGTGPNRFSSAWLQNRPEGINNTAFWNVDFNSGIGYIPTAFATTGILGAIAWLAFLGIFLYSGFRALFAKVHDGFSHYLVTSSFLASLFLWIFAILYIPNVVMLALTFTFTGVFVASLVEERISVALRIRFAGNPAVNFVSVLVSVLFIIFSVVGGYMLSERYVASILFQKGIAAFNIEGNVDGAQQNLIRAVGLHEEALYYRALAELSVAQINALLGEDLSNETISSQFQQSLATGIQSAQRAVEIDSLNYQNHLALGRIYEAVVPLQIQGSYESAKTSIDRALELNPQSPAIYLTLARLEAAHGDNDAARGYINSALSLRSSYTAAIFLLSQIEIADGNLQAAIQSVRSATLLSPNDPVVFFQLGLLQYNVQDYENAKEAFERSVSLNPQYANAMYFLGLTYYELGNTDSAVEMFDRVAELNPDNQEVQLILSNLEDGRSPLEGGSLITPPEDRAEPPIPE